MRKFFILLFLFAACLASGFSMGASAAQARESTRTGSRAVRAHTPRKPAAEESGSADSTFSQPSGQRNILLVGVDDLQSGAPRLESLWLVLYYPPAPGINLVPLFPDRLQNDPQTGLSIQETFLLSANGAPDPTFFESLSRRDLWWNNFILIDREGMVRLLDSTGCEEMENGIVCAEQAIDGIPAAGENPAAALAAQTQLLQNLCAADNQNAKNLDPLATLELMDGHVQTDLTTGQIQSDWEFLGISRNRVCKFPTQPDPSPRAGLK